MASSPQKKRSTTSGKSPSPAPTLMKELKEFLRLFILFFARKCSIFTRKALTTLGHALEQLHHYLPEASTRQQHPNGFAEWGVILLSALKNSLQKIGTLSHDLISTLSLPSGNTTSHPPQNSTSRFQIDFRTFPRRHPFLAGMILLSSALALTAFGVALYFFNHYYHLTKDIDVTSVKEMKFTTIVYDRQGEIIQRLYNEHRLVLEKEDIPEIMKQAVIATEDQRFYHHHGVDFIAITRAVLRNILASKIRSGASTITQQLARNAINMFERTLDRKIKEAFIAWRIENHIDKEEILYLYLNKIHFGRNLYGIGSAADAYFGKNPKDLQPHEAALLAGIISAPNKYSPWYSPDLAQKARHIALTRMAEQGYLTQDELSHYDSLPIEVQPIRDIPGSYVISALQEELPEELSDQDVFQGGLNIYTTIDLRVQKIAEKALDSGLSEIEKLSSYKHHKRKKASQKKLKSSPNTDYLQGAFVAIDNTDGGVLAILGGRHYEESHFNRAILAKRQVGSSIKPFVYTHAFNTLNITAFTEVNISPFDLTQVKHWPILPEDPLNAPPAEWVSIRDSLRRSNNYGAMRTGMAAGTEGFARLVNQITGGNINPFPSSFLGAAELTPFQMTKAYTIFPNQGTLIKPHIIDRIESPDGKILYRHTPQEKPVILPQISFQMTDIMKDVVNSGTAASLKSRYGIKPEWPIAGKTGTTNDYKDCWFVGFSSHVTAGVWVGLDQPRPIIPQGYSSRIAVPVWGKIMKEVFELYPPEKFQPPTGLTLSSRGSRVIETIEYTKSKPKRFLFFNLGSKQNKPRIRTTITHVQSTDNGRQEYVRLDQRGQALARIDPSVRSLDWTPPPPDPESPAPLPFIGSPQYESFSTPLNLEDPLPPHEDIPTAQPAGTSSEKIPQALPVE